jgi:hypothetical protein
MGITQQIGASSLIKPGVIDNAAARPASPYEGQVIFQKDTDQLLIWDGSAWYPPKNTSWGYLTQATKSVTQSVTTEADLSGLSITWTAVANRKYRITVFFSGAGLTGSGVTSVYITDSSNNKLSEFICYSVNGEYLSGTSTVIVSPSAGSVTYKARAFSNQGFNFYSTAVRTELAPFINVEDIGPA